MAISKSCENVQNAPMLSISIEKDLGGKLMHYERIDCRYISPRSRNNRRHIYQGQG